MKNTAFTQFHIDLGAKMLPFCGFNMPIEYSGINDEHMTVREKVGVFDVSHMGEVSVKGKEATQFVQFLVTNDVNVMLENQVIYAQMCYEHGGIVDDLLVYKYDNDEYFLVINASNVDKDFAWMQKVCEKFDVDLVNLSEDYSELALQGPEAQNILQKLTDYDLSETEFNKLKRTVNTALNNLQIMKKNEGQELAKDLTKRISSMGLKS